MLIKSRGVEVYCVNGGLNLKLHVSSSVGQVKSGAIQRLLIQAHHQAAIRWLHGD